MTMTNHETMKQNIADQLIRDLVEAHPDVMTVLAPYGIDLCCGGGHPLGEALDLHGIPREPVVSDVARILDEQSERA